MKSSSLAGPLFAAAFAAALSGCGGGVDVTYRRTPGEVRNYLRVMDVQGTNPVTGVKGGFRSEVTTRETTLDVRRREASVLQLEARRLVIEVRGEGPDPVYRLDSDVPELPGNDGASLSPEARELEQRFAPLRLLAGTRVDIEQVISGQVARPTGVDVVKAKFLAAHPEGDKKHQFIENYPWEEFYIDLLRPAICVPKGAAAVGEMIHFMDQKKMAVTVGTGGFLYYVGTSGLAKVENGVARMEMSSDVLLDPPGPNLTPWSRDSARNRRFLRLNRGVCKAWARIDVATGELLEDEHVTELDLYFIKPDGKGEVAIPTTVTLRSKRIP